MFNCALRGKRCFRPRFFLSGVLLLVGMTASGCVERTLEVTSEPPGAKVVINNTVHGVTPFTYRFNHYGVHDIYVTKTGYYPLRVAEPVTSPVYQRPFLDFSTDVLYPGTIKDTRQLHYVLEKIGEEDDIKEIVSRGREMKRRVGIMAAKRAAREKKNKSFVIPLILKTKKEAHKERKKKRRAEEKKEEAAEAKRHKHVAQPKPELVTPPPPPAKAKPKVNADGEQQIFDLQ